MANEDDRRERRIRREKKTMEIMVAMYCRDHHAPEARLCENCAQLLAYANARLDRCPFQADKPACSRCRVHCYLKEMRERVREVMRYSGPRMLRRHPYLGLRHLIDDRLSAAGRKE